MRFSLDALQFSADQQGRARPPAARASGAALRVLDTEVSPGVRARFDRWYRGRSIAAINLYYRVAPRFVDLSGAPVDPELVSRLVLEGSQGRRHVFTGGRPQWLQGNRVVPESEGTRATPVFYVADRVEVAGSSVVHRAQQRFFPTQSPKLELRLLFFSVRFTVRDALLGFPIGSGIRVSFPGGQDQRERLGPGGELTLRSLPRGDYRVRAEAPGISSARPIALSRDQQVQLQVISWLDVAVVLLGLASIALALFFARRPARLVGRG